MKNLKRIEEVVKGILSDKESAFYSGTEVSAKERLMKLSLSQLEDGKELEEIEYGFLESLVQTTITSKKMEMTKLLDGSLELWITDFTSLFPSEIDNDEYLSYFSNEEAKEFLKGKIDEMFIERK